jgi:hypothetical protein
LSIVSLSRKTLDTRERFFENTLDIEKTLSLGEKQENDDEISFFDS